MGSAQIRLNGGPLDGQVQADPSSNQIEVVHREPVTIFETSVATLKPGFTVAGFYFRSIDNPQRFDWREQSS